MGRRLRRQARPLLVGEVQHLESLGLDGSTPTDRHLAGFFCLMAHGRLRYSDAMRLMGPYDIDTDASGNPVFLEVEAEWVKMGSSRGTGGYRFRWWPLR
eukprot:3978196-Amphidinium_carterae.1